MDGQQESRHGVVVVGDSLATGYGLALGGVSCRSVGDWLGWAGDTCVTTYAVNGATARQVARDQVPLLVGSYQIGFAWFGPNDLAVLDGDLVERSVRTLAETLACRCDAVLIATLPVALRVPDAGWRAAVSRIQQINVHIRRGADIPRVSLLDLEHALQGPWQLAPDRQHPTSLGQLETARAAASALDGVGVRFVRHLPDPSQIAVPAVEQRLYDIRARDRLRGSLQSLHDLRRPPSGRRR